MKNRDGYSMSNAAVPDRPARLATWLIQRAARHAPPSLTPRLEEEWLADLGAQSGVCAKLRFALGCCWATQVIAHNPLAFRVTASSVAAGHGAIAAFAPQDVPSFSRRSSIGLAVLGLHIAVAYAFLSGFINPPIAPDPEPLRAAVIYQPSEPTLTPPGPHLGLTTFEPFAPPRDVSLKLPTMVDETNSNLVQPPQEATSMTQQMIRVLGGPGVGFPRTNDFYPAASIRLGEAGASAVRVCVDSDGRLIGDPKIAESSGSARLDAGALALSRAGSGHYRSTTEDGKPVASCYAYRVRFQMR